MHCSPSRSPVARALVASILASTWLLSRPCVADDRRSTAVEWVKRGVDDFKRSDYESARVAFGHAYEVEPKATTLLSLALAELQSGHALEAVRHLRAYVRDPDAEPAKVDVVRSKWLPRAEEQTARVVVEAPPGAEVLVDGQTQGTAPLADPVDVSAGEHEVVARLGSWLRSTHVSTTGGQVFRAHFEMAAEPPPAPAAAPPAAPPPPPPAAPEGPAIGRSPSAGKIVTVVSLTTAALVAAGLGVVCSVDAQSDASHVTNLSAALPSSSACTGSNAGSLQCTTLQHAIQTYNQDRSTATGLYITGGVLAGAALVTWLVWPNQRTQSAWYVHPTVEARTAGVVLDGSF